MKKFLSLLLAVTMIVAMFAIPVAAEDTVNYEEEFKFTKEAPNVDGKVSKGEYGTLPIHTYPEDKNQFVDDEYNEYTEEEIGFEFYGAWDKDYIYMAWVIEAADHIGIPEQDFNGNGSWDEEDYGYMWMYSCVQFILTPGAPAKGVTKYQTSGWTGDYLEAGLALTAENNPIRFAWNKPVAASALAPNEWDAAIVRDDAKKTTTYEVRIPWSKTGVDEIGNGAQFGFTYAVASQDFNVKPGMIEWQDGVLGGKNADNAAVITLTGAPEETKVTVEEKMLEALGTAPADAKLDLVIDAPETYKAGDDITVTVTVKNITAENGIHVLEFAFYYDNEKLLLTNDLDEEDNNALICIETLPKGWENLSNVANDWTDETEEGETVNPLNDGKINVIVLTDKTSKSAAVKDDGVLVFTFTFKALEDAKGDIGLVIPHAEAEGAFNTEMGADTYTANGDYAVIHQVAILAGKDATCTEEGLTEGLYCVDCGKILVKQETIEALGHDIVEHDAKAPTCTEIGWDAYETCSRCDYSTYVELEALGHDIVEHDAKAPTCTEIGWDAYETCTKCDYTTYVEIEALGHDTVEHDAKAPTCTEIGWDAYETCTRCDHTTYEELEALGHDDGEWVTTVEPTLDSEGAAELRCTACGTVLDEKVLPALRLLGDVTGDGKIDKYDYIAVKRNVMNTLTFDENQMKAADVNGDGKVDKYDYVLVKRHVMGTYKIEGAAK